MTETKNGILEAYRSRQAIKEFTDQKISSEDFEFILETGRLSPSSFGWEPWNFLVIQNSEVREKLKEFSWGAKNQLPTSSHFVIILGKNPKHLIPGSEYFSYMSKEINKLPDDISKMKQDIFKNFMDNDFDLTNDRKIYDWVCKQTYIPLGNMMTAAAQIGIDSCPIEGFDKEKIEKILEDYNILDTSEYSVSVMVAFGYKKADLDWPKTRRPKDKVITWVK